MCVLSDVVYVSRERERDGLKAALYNHRGLLLVIKRRNERKRGMWGPALGSLSSKWDYYYYLYYTQE